MDLGLQDNLLVLSMLNGSVRAKPKLVSKLQDEWFLLHPHFLIMVADLQTSWFSRIELGYACCRPNKQLLLAFD